MSFSRVNVLIYPKIILSVVHFFVRRKNDVTVLFCLFSPLVRKLHLVVTAMREFIQAIASYKLIPYLSPEDKVSSQIADNGPDSVLFSNVKHQFINSKYPPPPPP
jgi:hypothetical protein